jgi:hypothetical protein
MPNLIKTVQAREVQASIPHELRLITVCWSLLIINTHKANPSIF